VKKIITRTLCRISWLQDRQLTIGLDVGDRSSFYCAIDGKGEVILEAKIATLPEALKETFGRMPRGRIALETGTHSPSISRLLSELGHEAIVAYARDVHLIGESRRKDDKMDARTLARLARVDPQLLSPIQHRSAETQADLSVIRARYALVRARMGLICAARGLAMGRSSRSHSPITDFLDRKHGFLRALVLAWIGCPATHPPLARNGMVLGRSDLVDSPGAGHSLRRSSAVQGNSARASSFERGVPAYRGTAQRSPPRPPGDFFGIGPAGCDRLVAAPGNHACCGTYLNGAGAHRIAAGARARPHPETRRSGERDSAWR
jgi:transposase